MCVITDGEDPEDSRKVRVEMLILTNKQNQNNSGLFKEKKEEKKK